VTIFPGDGIGPEITEAVLNVFAQLQIPVEWEFHQIHTKAATSEGDLITKEAIDSVRRNKFALKGEMI
jgi:isocitrate dehydrogenase (NAD+)